MKMSNLVLTLSPFTSRAAFKILGCYLKSVSTLQSRASCMMCSRGCIVHITYVCTPDVRPRSSAVLLNQTYSIIDPSRPQVQYTCLNEALGNNTSPTMQYSMSSFAQILIQKEFSACKITNFSLTGIWCKFSFGCDWSIM